MNEKKRSSGKADMRMHFCLWMILCCACMSVMLWYVATRTVVTADVSLEQSGPSVEAGQQVCEVQVTELALRPASSARASFCVPLPRGIRPENVVMENRYMDRELWIYIQCEETDFYSENDIYGDVSHILEGCSETWESGLFLKLKMAELMEYHSTLEDNVLTITCGAPHEMYDFVVVLDPAGGGSETGVDGYGSPEKELTLEVARQVQRSFSMPGVGLYVTRLEDVEVSREERIGLAEAVSADLYIRIGVKADETDPEMYGIQGSYSWEYFIPGFGNAELADIVTREVTIASSNRAAGLVAAGKDSILRSLDIPAMELSVGYLSNPQEKELLGQETYREKLAEGIANAIREACERLKQLDAE